MVGVVLMMLNYEGGGVVVLWCLVLGGKSLFECGSSGTNGRMEYLLFFVSHFSRAKKGQFIQIFPAKLYSKSLTKEYVVL